MNRFTRFFDSSLGFIITFSTSYYVFGRTFGATSATLLMAATDFAFAATALWVRYLRRRPQKKNYDKCLPFFIYKSNRENTEYIFRALSERCECSLCGNKIACKSADVIVLIRHDALTCGQAIDIALAAKRKTLLVVSAVAKGAVDAAKKTEKPIKIMTFAEFAPMLEKLGYLPEPRKTDRKQKLLAFLDGAINPALRRQYLFAALLMLLLSRINGFSIYYLIFGAILFALHIITLIRAKTPEN